MGKRITAILVIIICLLSSSCTRQNSAGSNSLQGTLENSKVDYSIYTGIWVTEANLKNDFLYGITAGLTVDKEGNIKGQISDCTENLTHIANVDITGKIQDGKFAYKFDEDGWEHNGTINMEFRDGKILLNIAYGSGSSENSFWGIGTGTFELISNTTKVTRTLSNLKDGGLQVINDQSFDVYLENYGKVRFTSGLKREDASTNANFYLIGDNNIMVYKFPTFYGNGKGQFMDIKAVSFADVDNDGLKDIIILAEYSNRNICSIYFQKGNAFANNNRLDDKINEQNPKSIKDIIKYGKELMT